MAYGEMETVQLKLKHSYVSTKSHPYYECTLEDWDLGVSFGYGNSIPEAIESFLEWEYDMNDLDRPDYKWRGNR